MLNILPGAGVSVEARSAATLSTRIITYAWGEKYLDLLLSLNLPALLAPGNIPHLAARLPCQLVILTEERLFPRVASHPAAAQVRNFCDLRLMALDDLVAAPDKYGMALSYVLHRGFADLGPAMTDSWQIFLNADFILADGSLRALLPHLMRGERLVAAPSYCVNATAATAELLERIDPETLALSVPPRELAALILKHRHNTVRGKTVSQRSVSMRYMDQFYWEVDPDTLLGCQMPVAIVGLRPERHVREPNAYWDYGLMREFCPDAKPCVLGDSDEFLMLELRSESVSADELSLGRPTPAEIASRLISFITPYQREFIDYPLTLHASDLPASVEAARAKLEAYVSAVLAHLPGELPSHINHPQWRYHQPGFTKARHQSLSTRLGLLTTHSPPPEAYSALDKVWWQLDGLEKSYPRRRKDLQEAMERDLKWADAALAAHQSRRSERERHWSPSDDEILLEIASLPERAATAERIQSVTELTLHRQAPCTANPAPEGRRDLDAELEVLLGRRTQAECQGEQADAAGARDVIRRHYERRLLLLDADYEVNKRHLQFEFARLMPKEIASAGVPHIDVVFGPDERKPTGRLPARLAARVYHHYFGKMPRVTRLSPHWAPLRHVTSLVDAAAAAGARNVFVISSRRHAVEDLVAGFAGKRARATPAIVLSDSFPLAFPQAPDLHLCLCILEYGELEEFPRIVEVMAPCMRPGSTIVAVHLSESETGLSTHDPRLILALARISRPVRVHFAGSVATARLAVAHQRAGAGDDRRLLRAIRVLLMQLRSFPQALAANRGEPGRHDNSVGGAPTVCSSITLEVAIADR